MLPAVCLPAPSSTNNNFKTNIAGVLVRDSESCHACMRFDRVGALVADDDDDVVVVRRIHARRRLGFGG